MFDLIVIGGGPAGIFSALYAAKEGLSVAIIEKNKRMGRKLLAAGAGKCNLTHTGEPKDFLGHFGSNGKFLKSSLYNYKPSNLKDFFEENGLPLTLVEKTGKYFPNTFKSTDVVNLLYSLCEKYNISIYTENTVDSIEVEDNVFIIKSKTDTYKGKNILISTGGRSYPTTGSSGDGYILGKNLGHSIIDPKPSLTPIYVNDYPFSNLSGMTFNPVSIYHYRDDKKINEYSGSLLFTHKNFSGPIILDNSRYISRGDTIKINFIGYNRDEFNSIFLDYINNHGKRSVKRFLSDYNLPENFVLKILKLLHIKDDKKLSDINKKERLFLTSNLTEMAFSISKLEGFDIAMATAGGIDLKEINPKTMESKKVKGLYFAGEVVDIDGDTGGYNIQAACSMGVLAASSIIKKEKI